MVRGLDEGVHLPNLFERQSMTKGRHLRSLATFDHRFDKSLVAEFRREDVRSARAGALMTHQALALIDIAASRNGRGLAEDRIGQALLRVRDRKRRQTEEQSREADEQASAR